MQLKCEDLMPLEMANTLCAGVITLSGADPGDPGDPCT